MRQRFVRVGLSLAVVVSAVVGSLGALTPGSVRADDADVGIVKKVTGATMPLEPGGVFTYSLTASCSSLTTSCVNAVIEDVLPTAFEITSLPKSTDGRVVAYDAGTRRLTIRFTESLTNPAGATGLPAGVNRNIVIGMRVPVETTLADGATVPNSATIDADNAARASSSVDVTVRIPREVRPATTKKWADGSAVAQSGEESLITLGVRNGSSTSAEVTRLAVTDTTPAVFDDFDVIGVGPVDRFPAGADRVRVLVCTKPVVGSPCQEGELVAGPLGPGPAVSLPSGVDPSKITGVRFEFTAASGAKLPYDATGGSVGLRLKLRDTVRSTGEPLAPTTRQRVDNCATTTARDTVSGAVTGPQACASFDILPNIATVQGSKSYFSDTDGNFVADGTAVIGADPPVSMVLGARNTSSFPVATLTITEPSTTAVSEFDKFDAAKLRVEFPAGATSATVTVVCRDGSTPAPVQLSQPPVRHDLPATGCPSASPPRQVSVTFRGTDAKGSGTIATNAQGRLSLHGILNKKATEEDARDGVANCADVAATNPVDGAGAGAGTACEALRPQNPRTDIRGSKTVDQNELPPGTPVTFTLDLGNAGTTEMVKPAITDPADPTAAGNPFDVVRLTRLSVRYRYPSGLPVLLEVYDPTARAWVAYKESDTALLGRAKGVRARLAEGGLPPQNGRIIVDVEVVRRDGVADGVSFRNCAQITSDGKPVGGGYCTAEESTTKPASAAGSVQKTIAPSTVARTLPGVRRQEPDVRIRAENTGNVNLKRLVLTDVDADFFDAVDFVRLSGVTFPPGADRVRVDACTTGCAANPPVFVDGAPTGSSTPGLPAGVDAADVRGLRWTFTSSTGGYVLPPGPARQPGACPVTVCFKVAARQFLRSAPATEIPELLSDTASAAGESPLQPSGGLFEFGESEATLKVQEGSAQLDVSKTPDSRIGPGETAPFTLTVRNTGTGPVPGLVVADPVPELLRFDEAYAGDRGLPFKVTYTVPAGTPPPPDPVYEPGRGPDGRVTALRWRWPSWTMLPGAEIKITFQVKLAPGVPGDSVAQNEFGAGSEDRQDLTCLINSPRDGQVVDGQAYGKGRYCTSRAEITTLAGTAFEATKWVAGNAELAFYNTVTRQYVPLDSPGCPVLKQGDRTYTQFPCTALVQPGEHFDYLIRAVNSGTDPTTEIRLLDIFPYEGDTGVLLGNQQRGTEWNPRPRLAGPPTLIGTGNLATRYATVANPCSDLIATPRRDCAHAAWGAAYTAEASGAELRIGFPQPLAPGGEVFVRMPMASPADLDRPGDPAIAWNSFAHSETVLRGGQPEVLPTTEPPKVGVGMRFGNLRVDKVAENPPDGVSLGPYTLAYRCTVTPTGGRPVTVRDGTFEVTLYTPMALIGVPAGARCKVWETDSAGAHSSSLGEANASEVTITPATPDQEGQHITITNTYTNASLKVRKAVTGPAAAEVGKGPFTVRVDCSFNGERLTGFPKDLRFDGGGERSVDNLPRGARCTATEPGAGGATSVVVTATGSSDPKVAVIGSVPDETAGLTVANAFETGTLKIVKRIQGTGAQFADRTFRFRVACTFNGRRDAVIRTATVKAPQLTAVIDDLPVGAECTVTEVDPAGADAVPAPVGPVTIAMGAPAAVAVDVANTFSTGRLSLVKQVVGVPDDAPYAKEFAFRVTCVREGENAGGDPLVAFVIRKRYALAAGQTLDIDTPLPLGARCWAEETADGGATSTTVDHGSHATAAIVTKERPHITITARNTYDTGTLKLAKKVAGSASGFGADRTYALVLTCTVETAKGQATTVVDRRRYEITGSGERTVDDLGFPLPKGARCWAEEADTGGATSSSVDHGEPDRAVVISGGEDDAVTITATNTFDAAELTVAKRVVGTAGTGKGPFTFTVACEVRGAPLELPEADREFKLAAGASRKITVLKGATCTVKETDAPAGAKVTVADSDGEADGTVRATGSSTVTYTNDYGDTPPSPTPSPSPTDPELPPTGAGDVLWLLIPAAGAVALAVGLGALGLRSRRSRGAHR
ncbi:DUF5979 domain-containing protein [Streptomyces melanogenes]|uniref:DUF5979 domain-containing protein n=1 Tax=Streptomyces melanogenes TaxID=67326 RepID=UPI00167EB416|nr:DUF5979 domain-containing protein [Streptomyces melanogenes]